MRRERNRHRSDNPWWRLQNFSCENSAAAVEGWPLITRDHQIWAQLPGWGRQQGYQNWTLSNWQFRQPGSSAPVSKKGVCWHRKWTTDGSASIQQFNRLLCGVRFDTFHTQIPYSESRQGTIQCSQFQDWSVLSNHPRSSLQCIRSCASHSSNCTGCSEFCLWTSGKIWWLVSGIRTRNVAALFQLCSEVQQKTPTNQLLQKNWMIHCFKKMAFDEQQTKINEWLLYPKGKGGREARTNG